MPVASARISYGICPSVCPSVRHDLVSIQAQMRWRVRVFTIW